MTKLHRLEVNIGSVAVKLTAHDLGEIDTAAKQIPMQGERYPEELENRPLRLGRTNSATTAMSHVAIAEALDGKVVEWIEKVSDEEYLAGSESE